MPKIARFIIWICSKFTKAEIEQIVSGLVDVLKDRNPEVKPKDDFKEKHPNYRNFVVPPLPPLTEPPKKPVPVKDYKRILAEYERTHGKPLAPVRHRIGSPRVPDLVACPSCNAPHEHLYYNDGKKRTQLLCKVCGELFQAEERFRKKSKYYCPYCLHALFIWKRKKEVTHYKCCNDACEYRVRQIGKLNEKERELAKRKSSQFKLSYQYREYHYQPRQLTPGGPEEQTLTRAHNGPNVVGLVLAFYVSFALSARKTALVLRSVFGISISYQSVLNYAAAAAFYCHRFNLDHKGSIDEISAGDEAYIKVMGKQHYVFFFISSGNLKITAYEVADSRETLPAIIAMKEAIRTADPNQAVILVTDGNPSYPAGLHYLNEQRGKDASVAHKKVIGLQNLDSESEAYRPYKELIERLNRTFKHHMRPSHGFNSMNGAVALVSLFVTHYNFLRPHTSLKWQVPVPLKELEGISTIQGKWAKILSLAA